MAVIWTLILAVIAVAVGGATVVGATGAATVTVGALLVTLAVTIVATS